VFLGKKAKNSSWWKLHIPHGLSLIDKHRFPSHKQILTYWPIIYLGKFTHVLLGKGETYICICTSALGSWMCMMVILGWKDEEIEGSGDIAHAVWMTGLEHFILLSELRRRGGWLRMRLSEFGYNIFYATSVNSISRN